GIARRAVRGRRHRRPHRFHGGLLPRSALPADQLSPPDRTAPGAPGGGLASALPRRGRAPAAGATAFMIRFRHFAVALIGSMAAVAEVHAVQLDLPAAVDRAIEANPVLAAVAETRRQVAGGIREARADAFPQIALVSSWSQSRSPSLLNSPDFGEILDQFPGASF